MASSSSSPSTSDVVPSAAATATIVQAIDVYAELEKKRYQTSLLCRHKTFFQKEDFSLLVQCNLMDELIQTFENIDSINKASSHDDDDDENEKHDVTEGTSDEESSSDDDDDYDFDLSEEDDDDDDTSEENEHREPGTINKEIENQNLAHMDVSTQTNDELNNVSFDLELREQREIVSDYSYPSPPISDTE